MAATQTPPDLRSSLTPELRSIAIERTQSLLLRVVRPNLDTHYASKAPALAELRDAVSAHGSDSDAVFVDDFLRCVPLSDYDAYKPFMAAFEKQPCKEAEVKNLFAPGYPMFLSITSGTSGRAPKWFAKYGSSVFPGSDSPAPVAMIFSYGCGGVKDVEREPGSVVEKIPILTITGGTARAKLGWTSMDDEDSRLSVIVRGRVAPWAAFLIQNHKSFLIIHALFALARRDLFRIGTTFATVFYDLVRHVDEAWDLLLSSIKNGTVPDLPGVGEYQPHLQVNLRPNPERAAELGEIGRPFSCEGWASRVWPELEAGIFICSGSFAPTVAKVKSILGPTVNIRTPGYLSTESFIAPPYRPNDLDTFILRSNDLVEFLDVTTEESHENLRQAWELEVGKQYEIVLTTRDGLWRYRLGDTIHILGFDQDDGSPVFGYFGRRSSAIRLSIVLVADTHIIRAIQAVSPDVLKVNEFTTAPDWRGSIETVGYFVEPAETLGPNAHLASSKLGEALAADSDRFQYLLEQAKIGCPTVRIVRPGTFAEYRQWKAEKTNAAPGQVKVPVVLPDEASREWVLERVIGEL